MAAIGPQMPERFGRKRSPSVLSSSSRSSRSYSHSPSRSVSPQAARAPIAGPQLPAGFLRSRSSSDSSARSQAALSDDEDDSIVGPTLPSTSSIGTSNGSALNDGARLFLEREARRNAAASEAKAAAEKAANSRPEWMLLPPSLSNQSSLQAVAGDPLKLKSRGFAQSTPRVSARGGGGDAEDTNMSMWTETPEERLKRMQDEVAGVAPASTSNKDGLERERLARRDASIAANIAQSREKKTLVEEHNERRRRELKDKNEDEERERRKRRRRRDEEKSSRRDRNVDERDRGKDRHRSRSPDGSSNRKSHHASDRHDHKSHRSSRHDSHSHATCSSSRHRLDRVDDQRRDRHRDGSRDKDRDRDRGERRDKDRKQSRKEREEQEVGQGKAAPPMIWDRESALSVGGRLMDEKKRAKLMSDANALGDRFGSGNRRFL